MLVLRATGYESEAQLEFSGLVEVCRPLLGSLDALPPVQSATLSSALGLSEPARNDRFAVAAATLSLIACAAEEMPVLVLVDDAHWLDEASLDALLFVARRLVVDPVAFLFASRPEGLLETGMEEIELGGLERGSAELLVARAVGSPIAAPVLESLLEATAGNPLALIEIPSALTAGQRAGVEPILPLALSGGAVERAFAGRLDALADDAREVAAVFATADGNATAPARAALAGLGLPESGLATCEDSGILTLLGDRFFFAHPLLRAAAYSAVSPTFRRAIHKALAAAIGEPDLERWAWHLAMAAVAPDDDAADALARAAAAARAKHAHADAAAALERAASLTSDTDRRDTLTLDAAEAAWTAGMPTRAIALSETLLDAGLDRDLRMRALQISGRAELQIGVTELARERLVQALELCGDSDPDRAANTVYFACLALWMQGRIDEQIALSRRGVELAAGGTQTGSRTAQYMLGQALTMGGRSAEAATWLRAAHESYLHPDDPGDAADERRAAFCLFLLCRSAEATTFAESALAHARTLGPLQTLWATMTLTRIALQTCDWDHAEGLAAEAVELAGAIGQVGTVAEMELVLARIAGARGEAETCSALVERSALQAQRSGNAINVYEAHWARGRAALATDRLDDAVSELSTCADWVTSIAMLEVELAPEPDLVEALVRLGRTDGAMAVLERWLERGADRATAWAPPLIATCRALLADDDRLETLFHEALALHERSFDRYAEARARLFYGERLRRAGRRVMAREELRRAHALFTDLRCDVWAARASRELRASGERLRSAAASGDDLTPQEREIALQVAGGKANKEVAVALFLSPKTVEFHLSRVYRKLGVSSRTELASLFAGGAG